MSQQTQGEKEGWPDWATDRLNRQYMLMANITISGGPFSCSVDQRQLQFQPTVVSNFDAPGQIIRPSTTPLTNHHSSRPRAADRSVSEQQASQKVCVMPYKYSVLPTYNIAGIEWRTAIHSRRSYPSKNRDFFPGSRVCGFYR